VYEDASLYSLTQVASRSARRHLPRLESLEHCARAKYGVVRLAAANDFVGLPVIFIDEPAPPNVNTSTGSVLIAASPASCRTSANGGGLPGPPMLLGVPNKIS
jgi:hypothetical protein